MLFQDDNMRDPAASIRCFILIRSRRIASVVVSQYVLLFSCNNVLISVGFTKTPSLFVLLLMVTMPQLQTNHVGLGSPHTHTHTHTSRCIRVLVLVHRVMDHVSGVIVPAYMLHVTMQVPKVCHVKPRRGSVLHCCYFVSLLFPHHHV